MCVIRPLSNLQTLLVNHSGTEAEKIRVNQINTMVTDDARVVMHAGIA